MESLPSLVLLPELFSNDFPGPFCLEKSFPKNLGNDPKGNVIKDLGFPPRDDRQQSQALQLDVHDCDLYLLPYF